MLFLAIRSQILHSFSCPVLILHNIGSERAWSLHAPFPHEEQCLHCPVFWLALCWICVSDVWALPVSVAELKPNSSRVRNSLCPDVTSLYCEPWCRIKAQLSVYATSVIEGNCKNLSIFCYVKQKYHVSY